MTTFKSNALVEIKDKEWLKQFHLRAEDKNGKEKIVGVYDYAIFNDILQNDDMFVLGNTVYLYDNGYYKPDQSEAVLSSMIRTHIYPKWIKSNVLTRVHKLFLKAVELQVTPSDLNKYPQEWICFKNGMFDPVSWKMHAHDPRYNCVNQTAMSFNPDAKLKSDLIDEWLEYAFPEPDDREMLLQYSGYSMTKDMRQQKFLILKGEGGTGKSTLLSLIESIIGEENTSHVSMKEMTERFFAAGLMGKLMNNCADIESTPLEDATLLKKIFGNDFVTIERKGENGFSAKLYAKMIFSANEIPTIKNEVTRGFFRKLLVLPMQKAPANPQADFMEKLKEGAPYFLQLCMEALHRMYQTGHILESKHSQEAVKQLRMDCDSAEAFLTECAEIIPTGRTERGVLYHRYKDYCDSEQRQPLSNKNFFKALRAKGFVDSKSGDVYYFRGISVTGKSPTSALNCPESALQSTLPSYIEVDATDFPF